jgi:hypothetical protein
MSYLVSSLVVVLNEVADLGDLLEGLEEVVWAPN